MPRNGSGVYSRAVADYTFNTVIDQDQVNDEMDDVATALTNSLAKDGQTTPTANIPMGGFKLTGLGAPTAVGDALRRGSAVGAVTARSSNTILASADCGSSFVATSTFTQTLTAAATLGAGWYCSYRNDGTGIITLDPDGSEEINGATSLALYPGDSCVIVCDSSAFKTYGLPRVALVSEQSPSAVGQADITGLGDTQFARYVLEFDLVPATDDVYLGLRVGTGGTPTYQTADYVWGGRAQGLTSGSDIGATANTITDRLALMNPALAGAGVGNASGEHIRGVVEFSGPEASTVCLFHFRSVHVDPAGIGGKSATGGGNWGSTTPITAIRLLFSSGNIASGSVRLYGFRQ